MKQSFFGKFFAIFFALVLVWPSASFSVVESAENQPGSTSSSFSSLALETTTLEFPHGLSVESVELLLKKFNLTPVRARHEQHFVGEYFFDAEAELGFEISQYRKIVSENFGAEPRVVAIEVNTKLQNDLVLHLLANAMELPAFTPDAPVNFPVAASTPASRASVVSSPAWAPDTVQIEAYEASGLANFRTNINWSYSNHSPILIEEDWSFEYDLSLYNYQLSGTRPNCPTPNNDSRFWASRFGTLLGISQYVKSWSVWVNGTALNGSDDYGVYLDYNDWTDSCGRLGFAFGVGFPQNLPHKTNMSVLMTTSRGMWSSSVYGAQLQLESNDCLGTPDTNCIGLEGGRVPAWTNVVDFSVVNPSAGWRLPGCLNFKSNVVLNRSCVISGGTD